MSIFGGMDEFLRRAAGGQFDPNAQDDYHNAGRVVRNAPPEVFERSAANALRGTDPAAYSDHITPGIGGTNPLGGMGGQLLQSVAMMLIQNMIRGRMGQGGGGGGFGLPTGGGGGGFGLPTGGNSGGFGLPGGGQMGGGGRGGQMGGQMGGFDVGDLLRSLGIGTTDPQRMTDTDVARLAAYAQQNDPNALAQTATQFQGQPDVLRDLLGDAAYGGTTGHLATEALNGGMPGVRFDDSTPPQSGWQSRRT